MCVEAHDYQVPLSDTSDSDTCSDSEYQWQYSRTHLISIEEKYKYLHKKNHTDFTAVSFKRTDSSYTASVIRNVCPLSEGTHLKKTKRFCTFLPHVPVKAFFEEPTKRISFRKTSFQSKVTYKPKCQTLCCSCKEHKCRLFVKPKKLFYCNPSDQKKIKLFDVSVLYPKEYKWTKSDAHFDFESSDSEEDFVLSDSTDCTDIVLKSIEERQTVKVMSQDLIKMDNSMDYSDVVNIDMKKAFAELQIKDDVCPKVQPVHFPKTRSLSDKIDISAPLPSLKLQLKRENKLKRQLIATYNEQLQVLKRIKLEMKLCTDCSEEINTQIDLRESVMHTKKTKKLSKTLALKIKGIESEVKPLDTFMDAQPLKCIEPLDSNLKTEDFIRPVEKKSTSVLCAKSSFLINFLSLITSKIIQELLLHVKSVLQESSLHLNL